MTNELEIIREFPFEFYGETYRAYLGTDRNLYIRLSDLCEALGLDYASQWRRVRDSISLSRKLATIVVDTPYQNSIRKRNVVHFNIEGLAAWLYTIETKRVRSEIRERIEKFQVEFVDTVWMLYRSDIVSDVILAELDAYKSPFQRELSEALDQVRSAINRFAAFENRLLRIEAFVSDTAIVNDQQQWQLQQMLHAVGEAMYESKGGKMPKTQCHALTQNDFKREFQVPVYSLLKENKMNEAVKYLTQRYQHFKPGTQLPEVFTDGIQSSLF
jgi:antirepressor protein